MPLFVTQAYDVPEGSDNSPLIAEEAAARAEEHRAKKGKKTLAEKKGTGIHSRIIYHVPLRTTCISRRITHCDNFDGSKQMHQFLDIGEEGKVLVRRRPCNFCAGCMALDKEKIMNDCEHVDRCGIAKIVEIKPKSGARAEVPADKNAICGRRAGA